MSFSINQKYIAKTLCENRNRPQMHCNGKCYLAKKLKALQKEEQKQAQRLFKLDTSEVMALAVLPFACERGFAELENPLHACYVSRPSFVLVHSIFHPPQA